MCMTLDAAQSSANTASRKLAERYHTFLSKVISQATKAAAAENGTSVASSIYHARCQLTLLAEQAVEVGSLALTCLEKIRGHLKYKDFHYERSMHAFIARAVFAKQVRRWCFSSACNLIISIVRSSITAL